MDDMGSGIANIRPQSLANLMKVCAPTAAVPTECKCARLRVGPLACSPALVTCWRLECTQVGSDGKTDPQELKDTLSRLPSKTLPDQQPPGQLVHKSPTVWCMSGIQMCFVLCSCAALHAGRLLACRSPDVTMWVWCVGNRRGSVFAADKCKRGRRRKGKWRVICSEIWEKHALQTGLAAADATRSMLCCWAAAFRMSVEHPHSDGGMYGRHNSFLVYCTCGIGQCFCSVSSAAYCSDLSAAAWLQVFRQSQTLHVGFPTFVLKPALCSTHC